MKQHTQQIGPSVLFQAKCVVCSVEIQMKNAERSEHAVGSEVEVRRRFSNCFGVHAYTDSIHTSGQTSIL